jgi:hypothetical protein
LVPEIPSSAYISANSHFDVKICKTVDIELTEEEKNGAVVIRDRVPYLILGTGKTFLIQYIIRKVRYHQKNNKQSAQSSWLRGLLFIKYFQINL